MVIAASATFITLHVDKMVALRCAVLLVCLAAVYGANFYNSGACPENKGVGDRWAPSGQCLECYCDQDGYGCSGCDTITPIRGCYTVSDPKLTYPECCPRLVCPPIEP